MLDMDRVKSGWAPSPPTFREAFLHVRASVLMGLQCLPAKVC